MTLPAVVVVAGPFSWSEIDVTVAIFADVTWLSSEFSKFSLAEIFVGLTVSDPVGFSSKDESKISTFFIFSWSLNDEIKEDA